MHWLSRSQLRILLGIVAGLSVSVAVAGPLGRRGGTRHHEAVRSSFYLTMRDGVRIAVDLSLPRGRRPGERIPALFRQTRYYRSFDLGWRLRFLTQNWPSQRKFFLAHGYAWLDVDVRGTGASFGRWIYPWSPDEIRDGSEIVGWISRQPWSNGKVGAMGASYDGASAEFLLVNRNPAVKAVAPEFTLFDAFSDLAFPGGVWLNSFTSSWQKLDRALDIDYVRSFTLLMPWIVRGSFHGVRHVDADVDRSALHRAIQEHEHNLNVAAMARAITYRDDAPWPPGVSLDAFSPFSYASQINDSGAALYFLDGWFDASFPQAALNAFHTLKNPVRVMIGPWGHGTIIAGGPSWRSRRSRVNPNDQLLRFFDFYLKGRTDQPSLSKSIQYFTLRAHRWNSTDQWPPAGVTPLRFYLNGGHLLSIARPQVLKASDRYRVDLSAGTGLTSRWDLGSEIDYPDRQREDRRLLCYTSHPIRKDMEVTGSPTIGLILSSTATDGEFFAYLEDVDPRGRVAYVSEGELRAIDRAVSSDPPYPRPGPYHSFKRKDALPLAPGDIVSVDFAMIPTSYLFKRGHAIRLALAGADRDHFAVLPGPGPVWIVYRDAAQQSYLDVPVRETGPG